ncbi:putative expansin-A17 [Vicia villosa]|uniref:putative expansin-A17 n=1 Tax=Vicia villosa TaxID=3911 RepID=UPI00273CB55A|nr:putative expansin-A17 [Vicia villosa]
MEKLIFIGVLVLMGFLTSELRVTSADWQRAHATSYDGPKGGACGYGDQLIDDYGNNTAALSMALFNDGKSCGGCYQIVCDATQVPQWCHKRTSVTITVTNFCPPEPSKPNDNGGWCNPPRPHFDLSRPAFESIAIYRAGIVPILYRKVGCQRNGGIKFTMNGNDYFELVVISNVGGAGDISNVWIKGSKMENWESMSKNWGANWQSSRYLNGQSLSFRIQLSDGKSVTAKDAVPSNWRFGQTFSSNVQF